MSGHGANGGNGNGAGPAFGRALVVCAHPDDPEFLFGAAVATLVKAGARVGYVVCSDGANGSRDTAAPRERIAAGRRAEQRTAARALGVEDVVFLDFPDGRLAPTDELRKSRSETARHVVPPSIVFQTPPPVAPK